VVRRAGLALVRPGRIQPAGIRQPGRREAGKALVGRRTGTGRAGVPATEQGVLRPPQFEAGIRRIRRMRRGVTRLGEIAAARRRHPGATVVRAACHATAAPVDVAAIPARLWIIGELAMGVHDAARYCTSARPATGKPVSANFHGLSTAMA
jgi:hypothetical protein